MTSGSEGDPKQIAYQQFQEELASLFRRLKAAKEIPDPNERVAALAAIDSEIEASGANDPEIRDSVERSGDPLLLMFQHAHAAVMERDDLGESDKREAESDAEEFFALIEIFQETDFVHCDRIVVFKLALKALLTGLCAGRSPEEIKRLRGFWGTSATDAARKARQQAAELEVQQRQDVIEQILVDKGWGPAVYNLPKKVAQELDKRTKQTGEKFASSPRTILNDLAAIFAKPDSVAKG